MGADIYLRSVNDRVKAEWEPKFQAAVAARDAAFPRGGAPMPDGHPLQEAVTEAYDAMYGEGYYRDSYNSTSLFALLGLSWWQFEGYDDDGTMKLEAMKELLATLEAAPITDAMIAQWGRDNAGRATIDDGSNSLEAWKAMFIDKRERLMNLLKQGLELGEQLYCSV